MGSPAAEIDQVKVAIACDQHFRRRRESIPPFYVGSGKIGLLLRDRPLLPLSR